MLWRRWLIIQQVIFFFEIRVFSSDLQHHNSENGLLDICTCLLKLLAGLLGSDLDIGNPEIIQVFLVVDFGETECTYIHFGSWNELERAEILL